MLLLNIALTTRNNKLLGNDELPDNNKLLKDIIIPHSVVTISGIAIVWGYRCAGDWAPG